MNENQIIQWLMEGDVSVQYQASRDLLGDDRKNLRRRIAVEGWGQRFLSKRKQNGHWGDRFYQPKWTSTHYTLLDLRNLNLDPENRAVHRTIEMVIDNGKADDGGIPLGPSTSKHSDICVNGMFLNYASYFNTKRERLQSVVDSILSQVMLDGGFNCNSNTAGARHSSVHSTLSVLEGITEYQKNGYNYRLKELAVAKKSSIEFLLKHQLYLSDRTGEIINKDFLKLTYPSRWRYDVLRALDYLQHAGISYDRRIESAIDVLHRKRNKDNTWNMQAKHPGKVHFEMEKAGAPSRWNTLRAMRVLKHFKST